MAPDNTNVSLSVGAFSNALAVALQQAADTQGRSRDQGGQISNTSSVGGHLAGSLGFSGSFSTI